MRAEASATMRNFRSVRPASWNLYVLGLRTCFEVIIRLHSLEHSIWSAIADETRPWNLHLNQATNMPGPWPEENKDFPE